jgi:chromatin assembly factor 1 subunit A
LPLQVVEAAIKSILSRNNYGLEAPQGNVKMPAALCVWRWEVKSQYWDWLPKAAKEKAEARLIERVQVLAQSALSCLRELIFSTNLG